MVGEVRAKLHISFAILEISSIFQNEVSVGGCTSRVLGQHMFCVICETCMYSHVMPCQLVGKLRCSNFWEHQTVPHGATRCHTARCEVASQTISTGDHCPSIPLAPTQKRYNKKAIAWQRLTTFLQRAVARMHPSLGVHSLGLYRQPNPKDTSWDLG